jgi:two-component system, OmpR family, response regulator VicR
VPGDTDRRRNIVGQPEAEPEDRPLTSGDVARLCHVSQVAVWKWIKKGKLKAYRFPGGHYRIEPGAFREFIKQNNIPVDASFAMPTRKRVLIIDDEPSVVEVATRAVQRLGKDVIIATAGDGFEAGLQVATFRPDLLLLDLMMPGMDGFQVCRLVRNSPATAHVKIIIITAFGSHENLQRALQAGADDFIHKPVDLDRLLDKVRAFLS